jgi:phage FluMu protein Com
MPGRKKEVRCRECKRAFLVRVSDLQRGWGLYCSKRCKAINQTRDRVWRRRQTSAEFEAEAARHADFEADADREQTKGDE